MTVSVEYIWEQITQEARAASSEPMLASFYHTALLNHDSFASAMSFLLASKLDSATVQATLIRDAVQVALDADSSLVQAMAADVNAYKLRDPACDKFMLPILYFKGFHALQAYRISHWLWLNGRKTLAYFFQHQIALVFGVDIHPAATIGQGIMIDHATGVVIGETTVIGDDVSLLHGVTLGGSGCQQGRRHPQVGKGVLIATGAKLLGNITIGDYVKIGAGSVVLDSIPALATVAGVPAKIMGYSPASQHVPAYEMDHSLQSDSSDEIEG